METRVGNREWDHARSVSRAEGVKKSVYQRHQLEDSESSLYVCAIGWLHFVNEGQVMRFQALSNSVSARQSRKIVFCSSCVLMELLSSKDE